jgi:hypothetical protein
MKDLGLAQRLLKEKLSSAEGRHNAAAEAKTVKQAEARSQVKIQLRNAKQTKRRVHTARKLYLARVRETKLMTRTIKAEWAELEKQWRELNATIRIAESSLKRATNGSKAEAEAEALCRGYHLGRECAQEIQRQTQRG